MAWNKVKKLFKKKPKAEDKILRSRCVEEGRYEVGGIMIKADTHAEAINKYRKGFNYGH